MQGLCQQKGVRVLCEGGMLQTCTRVSAYSCRLTLLLTAVWLLFVPWHMSAEVWPATGSSALDGMWKTRWFFCRTQLSPLHQPMPLENSCCTHCPPHPCDSSSSLASLMHVQSGHTLKVHPFLWGWDKGYKSSAGVCISHPANLLHALHLQWACCLQTSFSALYHVALPYLPSP